MVSKQTLSRNHKQYLLQKIIWLSIQLLLVNKQDLQMVHVNRIKKVVLEMNDWLYHEKGISKFSDSMPDIFPRPESFQKRMEKLRIVI